MFLNNFKIRSRVLLLVLIPVAVVLLLVSDRLNTALEQRESLTRLNSAMQFARVTGSLLRDIQGERDFTYGFVQGTPVGSAGGIYRSKLHTQRETLDRSMQGYKTYINESRTTLEQLDVVLPLADRLIEIFPEIERTRSYIDQYKIQDEQGRWVVNKYGDASSRALDSIDGVLQLTGDNADLNNLLGVYTALLKLDAIYSYERSTKLRTFSQPTIDYTSHGNNKAVWRQIQDAQARIRAYAPYDVREKFNGEHIDLAVQSQIHELRFKLLNMGGGKYDLEPSEWFELSSENLRSLNKVITYVEDRIVHTATQAMEDASAAVTMSIVILVAVILTLIVFSGLIIRSVTRPLKRLVREMVNVSDTKDISLRIPVEGRDELSEVSTAFNKLQASLHDVLKGVLAQVNELGDLSSAVSRSMHDNQQRADNQNIATDSVSVAVNEMTHTIQEVVRNAQETADAVSRAHENSVSSAQEAKSCMQLMEGLNEELNKTQSRVNDLNDETEVIGNILGVIQSIAEQTNLLALNAAIEAARAGEQGRGFAVVADEVRTLASKTKESTEQIEAQIAALQSGSKSAASSMEQLKAQGVQAVDAVLSSVGSFETIRKNLDEISGMTAQIATAAEQQSMVADSINERIHAIKNETEEMTQETHAVVNVCQKLDESCAHVDAYVKVFKV